MGDLNDAHLGDYRKTLDNPASGLDISKSPEYRIRFGATLSAERKLTEERGAFLRDGWDDGRKF
jgi:high affinity Mn2+ porin